MGLIREPKGVDLIVEPYVLTEKDRTMISEIIANYKKNGKLPSKLKKQKPRGRSSSTQNKSVFKSKAKH